MYPEKHAHRMLFTYFSFRNEEELKFNSSYANKWSFPGVIGTVIFNRSKFESYVTILDDAFKRLQKENQGNIDVFGQQENDKTYGELNEEMCNSEDEGNDLESET